MSLYVGDVGPKAIPIEVSTGTVNGTTVTKVTVCGLRPDGSAFEWDLTGGAITSTTATLVKAQRVLVAGDLSVSGQYLTQITLYAGAVEVLATDEAYTIRVLPKLVPNPT